MKTNHLSVSGRLLALGITLSVTVALLGGCEKDEFAGAPSAQASSIGSGGGAGAAGNGGVGDGGAGPIAPGATLPSDHPPVGAGVVPGDRAPRPQFPVTGSKVEGYGKSGPLRWAAPEAWQAVPPSSSMRYAEYIIAAGEGVEPTQVTIFFFGPGQGGGIDENISRWVGQFKQPDGKPSDQVATRATQTVQGMSVHRVDVSGDFDAGSAMMGGGAKKDQRMIAVIVEAPAGLFFFKLVGDAKAVEGQAGGFDELVKSFTPGT